MCPSAMMQGIKDHWAPAVKDFGGEVVEPFGSRALCNLDPSHLLGDAMCPNKGARIPDYGVHNHIATCLCCFLRRNREQVLIWKIGDVNGRRSIDVPKWPWGTTIAPPMGPNRRTWEWDK